MEIPSIIYSNNNLINPQIIPKQSKPTIIHTPNPKLLTNMSIIPQLILIQMQESTPPNRIILAQHMYRYILYTLFHLHPITLYIPHIWSAVEWVR